jgi:hypothetical protein
MVHHQYINDTNSNWYQQQWCQLHRRQILRPVPLVLLTPMANVPPVSTIRRWQIATGINDIGSQFAIGVNDTGGKQWEQYQTADNLQ